MANRQFLSKFFSVYNNCGRSPSSFIKKKCDKSFFFSRFAQFEDLSLHFYLFFSFGGDDEDDIVSSGEGSSDRPVTHPSEPTHPVYYRIIFTIEEPYVEDFKDRNSYKYRDVSEELIRAIDNLYDPLPGTQSATVISIE